MVVVVGEVELGGNEKVVVGELEERVFVEE